MAEGFVALGLVQGALAALNSLGLVLLWRTTRVVNLAQPAMGLVGGVLTGMLVSGSGWSFWWTAPIGVATGAALGFLAERLVMVRLAGLPRVVPMVATIGLAGVFQALQSGIPFMLGGSLPSYDVDIGFEWFVFPVLLKGPHLLALAVLPFALYALSKFVHRSRIGTAAVALGQDIEKAQTLGVNAGLVRALAWSVAGALSGLAGVLSIPVLGFSLGDGVAPTVLLLALAPAVLAGLSSLAGTALASLAVGVGYQFVLVAAPSAGMADVLLAVVIVAALGIRRRPIEREAAAARASSWAVATDAVPLPRGLRRDRRWRRWARLGAFTLVACAALPPIWLTPSANVRYGTAAALVIAAVATASAWIFSGEIALGHWGIAALGATVTGYVSGPLAGRVVLGTAVGLLAGVGLGALGLRRGSLTAAVAGLALAVAAPYWLLRGGTATLGVDGHTAAVSAGAIAAVAIIGVTWLRGQHFGLQMIAARDDPRRAKGLGIDPRRARLGGMALSGGLAGLAGVVYLASVPAGIAPGAFDASRSLDVLAFAVVGGLGSALGAGLGASLLLAATVLLPDPWGSAATGFGVLIVVLFAPAGVSGALSFIRDHLARRACPAAFPARLDPPSPAADRYEAAEAEEQAIVAGADTRDAARVPTVRAAMFAAFCLGSPTLAALFGSTSAIADHLDADLAALAPWFVLGLAGTCAAAALVSWNWTVPLTNNGVEPEVLAGAGVSAALLAFVMSGDEVMVTIVLLCGPPVAVWVLARLAKRAGSVVVPRSRSAAIGLVVAATLCGAVGSFHLATVAAGNDLLDAARWAVLYVAVGTAATARAAVGSSRDNHRARQRTRSVGTRSVGRRYRVPLRVESVTVDFGPHRILDEVDLEVATGQLVALVGGNGSGKSTLLRTIAGLDVPTSGRIDVDGEEITALRPDERAAVGVALASGARPVFPDLTVRDNLRVGAFLTHRTNRSFSIAMDRVLALVPLLAGRLGTQAGVLSGGEQRHLAIAQALFRRPTLLLADELALGLDITAQSGVFGLLRTLADDGMGVVVVDHDLAALAPIVDRFVLIHDAKTTEFDDPTEFASAKGDLLPARFLTGAVNH